MDSSSSSSSSSDAATMSSPPNEAPSHQPEEPPPASAPNHPALETAEPEPEPEEEEGECGFCLFMKAGGCRDAFVDWEKCVQEAETNGEDLLDKCARVTAALKQCMDAHSDYYEPILRAEKLAEEQAIIELQNENQNSQPNDAQPQQHNPPPPPPPPTHNHDS